MDIHPVASNAIGVEVEQSGYSYLVYPDATIKVYDPESDEWILMNRHISKKGYVARRGVVGEQRLWVNEHQMVALAYLGPTPKGDVIIHKDKNSGNNHIDNLEFMSRSKASKRRGKHTCELV